jgi:hypothetical protein
VEPGVRAIEGEREGTEIEEGGGTAVQGVFETGQ